MGALKVNKAASNDIGKLLLQNYDCGVTNDLTDQIHEKKITLKSLEKLAYQGTITTEKIGHICSSTISETMAEVKALAQNIEMLDEKISELGFTHPELKPITDMYSKRKENLQGVDPVKLAGDTRNCYQKLSEESKSLDGRLSLVLNIINMEMDNNCQAAVSSFNVEVPGK